MDERDGMLHLEFVMLPSSTVDHFFLFPAKIAHERSGDGVLWRAALKKFEMEEMVSSKTAEMIDDLDHKVCSDFQMRPLVARSMTLLER